MVVTGLHLLGGGRADATRVRSGADRAVVEGRFTTTDLDDCRRRRARRDAGRVGRRARRGRQRDRAALGQQRRAVAGLSRRPQRARQVAGDFTTELLTLHGQNDQLRLMRPEEQRGALDRFAKAGPALERYRKLRDAWLSARRDLVRPPQPRPGTRPGGRPAEVRAQRDRRRRPATRRRRCAGRRHPAALRTGHAARGRRRCARDAVRPTTPTMSASSAADGLGRARAALESTDDATLRALAGQIGEALTVVVDAARELGDYLDELPADASALESKLARQAELRTLDPQVRRRHRRGAAVGGRIAGTAGPTRRLRRRAGGAGTPGRRAGTRISRSRSRSQHDPAARPPSDWPKRSLPSCPGWRWPTPNSPSR